MLNLVVLSTWLRVSFYASETSNKKVKERESFKSTQIKRFLKADLKGKSALNIKRETIEGGIAIIRFFFIL